VPSLVCLVLGGVIQRAAQSNSGRVRAALVTAALAMLCVLTRFLPFPDDAFAMGDGTSLAHSRDNFEGVVADAGVVRFSSHLAYYLLSRLDASFGATAESPLMAYRLLSWSAGAASVLCLWGLATLERWSARAVRYVGLVVMAPATLMYFGYLEVGYLSLWSAAFPLVARDLARRQELTAGTLAGALLFGLGAAMHGIGYLGIAALFAAVLASHVPPARRLVLAVSLAAIACGAALIWLWGYFSVLGWEVVPGHASNGFIVRPLRQVRQAEGRVLQPLLSMVTGRDLLVSGFIAGVPTALVALVDRSVRSVERRLALAFAVPCAITFALFWPVQGIAVEVDMLVAAFPAVFGLLWVCAQSQRATVVGAVLLALGHAAFWWVVSDERFVNGMLG
jgi:hypothetical protein